jgi:hypothetical protein
MSAALRKLTLFSFLFVVIYAIIPQMGIAYHFVFIAFLLSNALLIILVIAILKDPNASKKNFDDHFYEDISSKRIK